MPQPVEPSAGIETNADNSSSSDFNIEANIQSRIAEETAARRAARDTLDSTVLKIDALVARMADRPRETDGDIVAATKELEFKHATTSQDNASERQFMREMDKLRRKRAQIIEFAALQTTLDGLREKRKEMQTLLREKDRSIDDLYLALRKVRTAAKVGCEAAEVVEQNVVASEEKLPASVFRQLSEQFHVTVSTSKVGGERALRIQGLSKDVDAALARIEELARVVKQEIRVTAATIFCLLMCSATLVHRIESNYNVRIDLSRSNLTCKVIGQPSDVASAMTEIESIQSAEMSVPFELSALPAIIGKGGQGLRAIEEEHSVQVDIDKEKGLVKVLGFVDDVSAAVDAIATVSNDNRNVERCVVIQRHVTMSLLQKDGSAMLKSLRKNYPSVNIKVFKASELDSDVVRKAVAEYNRYVEHAGLEVIFLSGAAQRVVPAYQEVKQAVDAYLADEVSMDVSPDAMGYVVGKKGATIAALREAHPSADIDIDQGRVFIHSSDASVRRAVYEKIAAVVAENQNLTLAFPEDLLKLLVSPKGTELCKKIENELKVNLNIEIKSERVRMRGHADRIAAATALLNDFSAANSMKTLDMTEDDCRALLGGGDDSCIKRIASEYLIEIYVLRKSNSLKLRGSSSQVDNAAAAIAKILAGDLSLGSQLVAVDASDLSAIIGKGGETISKFQSDNDVIVDILRASNQLRLRSKTPEGVLRAVKKLRAFLDDVMGSSVVIIPPNLPHKDVQCNLSLVRDMFGVKCLSGSSDRGAGTNKYGRNNKSSTNHEISDVIDGPVTLQGKRFLLRLAEPYLLDLLSGTEHYSFQLTKNQFSDIFSEISKPSREVGFKKLGIKYSWNSDNHSIALEGPSGDAMAKAKVMLFRFLDDALPGQFAAMPLSSSFLSHFISKRLDVAIREDTETSLQFDFPLSTCRIGGRPSSVLEASSRIQALVDEWKQRCETLQLDDTQMIPYLLGKGGTFVADVQKQTDVNVEISDAKKCVDIRGPSREAVVRAKQMIEDRMRRYSEENWRSVCSSDAAAFLIGKAGTNIKRIREETKALLDIDIPTGAIRVSGSPDQVTACKQIVELTLKEFNATNSTLKIFAPHASLSFIVGKKGGTISDIQQKSGAKKIDLNRDSNAIVIRGSVDACRAARKLIDEVLAENEFDATTEHEEVRLKVAPAAVAEESPAVEQAAPLMPLKATAPTQLSKSALKRLRKKAALAAQTSGPDDRTEEEEVEASPVTVEASLSSSMHVVRLDSLEPISTPVESIPANSSARPFDKAPRSPSNAAHDTSSWTEAPSIEVSKGAEDKAFTPFSNSTVLVSPPGLISSDQVAHPEVSVSSPTPAAPVSLLRSMRSARAGILGAAPMSSPPPAASASVPSAPQPMGSGLSPAVGVSQDRPVSSSLPAIPVANPTSASIESSKLLSMLLSDEAITPPAASKGKVSGPPPGFQPKAVMSNHRAVDVPSSAAASVPGSQSTDGYYRSKGYSVRLN